MVFRFGGKSLLTSDKMSRELRRNGTFFLSHPPRATGIVLATGGGRMIVYPHMKRIGSISCICFTLLLSACTLTQQQQQQQPPLSAEEIEARQQAARELDTALIQEQERLQKEAERKARAQEEEAKRTEAVEPAPTEAEKARHRAEQEILAAEMEQARAEEAGTEEKADTSARPAARLFTTRGRQQPEDTADQQEEIIPTAEQQKAAQELLNKKPATTPRPLPPPAAEPAPQKPADKPAELKLPGSVTGGALRQHRFGPPAETLQDDDDEEQLPNSVELRGLRSPSMKGRLPLNIDGKINKN